jgi:DNA polymerase III subunit epsilon
MNLKLERPIVFFDLETTGLNISKDQIIEISLLKVFPDGSEFSKTTLVKPEIPISDEAFAVHGIANEDVKNAPVFAEIAAEIQLFLQNCDIAGYNSNRFDLPLLMEEFLRVGIDFDLRGIRFIDVQNIFHKMEPRTLTAAHKFYCNSEYENAHKAEADTRATYNVLKGQLDLYSGKSFEDKKTGTSIEISNDIKMLSTFTTENRSVDFAGQIILNEKDQEIFNFGKYKGKTVIEIFTKEPAYYDWMMKADFPRYTKKVIDQIWKEMKIGSLQNKFN